MKKTFLSSAFWIAGIILCSSILYGCSHPTADKYHVCALIWPSCHDDSLGRTNWPAGIGEWEVIQKGNPRFEGHYQPCRLACDCKKNYHTIFYTSELYKD